MCRVCWLQFHRREVDQLVDDGVDGEAGGRMDLQLAGDVAAVCDDRVERDVEMVGNHLVAHPIDDAHHHVALAVAEHIAVGRHGNGYVLLQLRLQKADGRDERCCPPPLYAG